MKKLIKWDQTPKRIVKIFCYIYRSDEMDVDTQVLYTEAEGDQMISASEAEEIQYIGSYLETEKLAEIADGPGE